MKLWQYLLVLMGITGLIAVRAVENHLFYDPFLKYFSSAYQKEVFPAFEYSKLLLNYLFRFALNLLFSAMVLHGLFKRTTWTFQGVVLMILVFAIIFPLYLYCIHTEFETGYLISFYMRRFVIQPIILLLIVPVFYYRQHLLRQKV